MVNCKNVQSAAQKQTGAGKLKKLLFKKYQIQGFIWILPAFAVLVLFSYIPPIQALIYSFTDWGDTMVVSFVGFAQYKEVFADTEFWMSGLNAILFTVCGIVLGNVSSILLSEMLYNLKGDKMGTALRFLFLLPSVVPGVVSILIWEKVIFLPDTASFTGLANALLNLVGLKGSQWYASADTIKLSIILTGFPFMGGTSFLIYLAGLQSIDASVIEASKLDGLGSFKRIFYIDLPLMKGQIKYFVLTGVIGGIQNYNMQLILQNGISAAVPGYYIYKMGIDYQQYGYACALGMVMFVIILALTVLNNKLMKGSEAND